MPITDLTGYTWVGNNDISESLQDIYYSFSLNFTSNNENFDTFILDQGTLTYSGENYVFAYADYAGGWSQDNSYKTIQITGGTDATNSTLIAWLQANGTLTAPIQANTYNLTHSLTNLTKGNITLQITPDTGYTYPSTLTVTNGTLVSYDNTTGIAVISGDDTTTVSGECLINATYNGQIKDTGDDGVYIFEGIVPVGSTSSHTQISSYSAPTTKNLNNAPKYFTLIPTFSWEEGYIPTGTNCNITYNIQTGSHGYDRDRVWVEVTADNFVVNVKSYS